MASASTIAVPPPPVPTIPRQNVAAKELEQTLVAASALPLYGGEIRQDYDVRKDTKCILTYPSNVVKGINDHPFQAVGISSTHRGRFHKTSKPMFRIMGQFKNRDRMNIISDHVRSLAPGLEWAVFPTFRPILLSQTSEHDRDAAYKNGKVRRVIEAYTERIAKEDDALRAATKLEDDIEAGRVKFDWYSKYQAAVMNAANAVFEVGGDSVEEERQSMVRHMLKNMTRKERREWQKAQRRREKKQAQRRMMQAVSTADGHNKSSQSTQAARKPRIKPFIHTAPSEMRDLFPQHKVAAVVIVLDETDDKFDEPVVFVLNTFETVEELKRWTHVVHPHMARYQIFDVPLWKWVDPHKRVNADVSERIYHNNAQQALFDQRRSVASVANDTRKRTQHKVAMDGGDVMEMNPEADTELFAEADAAMKEFLNEVSDEEEEELVGAGAGAGAGSEASRAVQAAVLSAIESDAPKPRTMPSVSLVE